MNVESVVPCRGGRDFVEITPRECGIVAAALSAHLRAAVDADSKEYAGEIDTLCRLFLSTAADSRVEGVLLFALEHGSDRKLWKSAQDLPKAANS